MNSHRPTQLISLLTSYSFSQTTSRLPQFSKDYFHFKTTPIFRTLPDHSQFLNYSQNIPILPIHSYSQTTPILKLIKTTPILYHTNSHNTPRLAGLMVALRNIPETDKHTHKSKQDSPLYFGSYWSQNTVSC